MTNHIKNNSQGTKALVSAAALIVLIFGLQAAQSILVPFIMAVFLAVITAYPMGWLKRKRVPNALALVLVVFGMLLLLALMATLVGTSINDFSERVPVYQQNLDTKLSALTGKSETLIADEIEKLMNTISPGAAMGMVAKILNGLSGVFGNAFLIIFTMIFILIEVSSFPVKLTAMLGNSRETLDSFSRFAESIRLYLGMKTLVSLGTGVLVGVWVAIIGLDFPILWGMLAFLFNFVPNIGSIIAAIPAILLSLVQLSLGQTALIAVGYAAINLIVGNVVEPRVMGRGLGISTLVVFVSLIFWGWIFGAVGMLLAVPLTMTLKIALESSPGTNRIAILLGSADSIPKAAREPVTEEARENEGAN
ncbi:MAG: AI-2E family transporter [Candidatus Hatepunaea meridiana]|nr:AI-2E family transporter [Candidatus Hatepunaea meridiana]